MTSQKWAVIGATGFVGSHVSSYLREQGNDVVQLRAPRLLSSAVDAVSVAKEAEALVDDADIKSLLTSLEGVNCVVNAAGLATPGDGSSPELTGANALLPSLMALICARVGVTRFIHLSSASVQGQQRVIDESRRRAPFSAYSASKALGEESLELLADSLPKLNIVTIRATSVQGPERPTTQSLVRIAKTPLASVAGDGTDPTPVSSIDALAWFVAEVGQFGGPVPPIVLQPWEGLSVADVLRAAGGKRPLKVPRVLCTAVLKTGYALSELAAQRLHGPIRRVELMWIGQRQTPGWAEQVGLVPPSKVAAVLAAAR